MKYTIVLLAVIFFWLSGCKQNKKKTTDIPESRAILVSWSDEEKKSFIANCEGFLVSEGVEDAREYCDCLLESSIENFPDFKEATALEQTEIVDLFERSQCIDELLLVKIEHPWTEEAEEFFITSCQQGKLGQGWNEEESINYCSCALEQIREIIPNPHHVISLTEEELSLVFNACKE